ncbi:hypothetical protein T07_12512 [Trichinella nelsoni]|uniref:Uncharacterized protein n=1 Tax=Trichinella nelsoni TaxID=6336 RepID=A0A0V0RQ61_9BILA|nr:hypothetical protein T07_12512 [Trichinella nelsoni]
MYLEWLLGRRKIISSPVSFVSYSAVTSYLLDFKNLVQRLVNGESHLCEDLKLASPANEKKIL